MHDSSFYCDAQKSRERVYGGGTRREEEEGGMSSGDGQIEESPKWHLLSMVLEEILSERKNNPHRESAAGTLSMIRFTCAI